MTQKEYNEKRRMFMEVMVYFPTHKEWNEEHEEEAIVPPREYGFHFEWKHKRHKTGTEEDNEYVINALKKYHEDEIEQKVKQIIYYYQSSTGAQQTTHEIVYDVSFKEPDE